MARTPRPWYRAGRGWYVELDGKQELLARGARDATRKEALAVFHRLLGARAEGVRKAAAGLVVGEVCQLLIYHARENLAPLTAEFYRRHLGSFSGFCGGKTVAAVAPRDVAAWLDTHPDWGPTTRAGAVTAVKRAFRWAARQGHIDRDPLEATEKPRPRRRELILNREQADAIRTAIAADDPFGDLLDVLRETGCRPSEAEQIEARHLDPSGLRVVMASKTTAETGQMRVIHLNPRAAAILARWAAVRPQGPLLRSADSRRGKTDRPWTRSIVKSRFARLRVKLKMGKEATAESYRHLFATDALERGIPIATVAELMGHQSTAMLSRYYSKLAQRHAHLREALHQVRPGSDPPDQP